MNDEIVPVDVGGSPYAQVAADELAAYDAFAAVLRYANRQAEKGRRAVCGVG